MKIFKIILFIFLAVVAGIGILTIYNMWPVITVLMSGGIH
jgi:heme A synthase